MGRYLALLLLIPTACATTPEPAPTKDVAADSGAGIPPPGDAELSTAWDREEEKPAAAPVRPPEEPKVDRFAGLKTALAEGQAALKGKKYDDARAAAQRAITEAATLDGEARFSAHQLASKVELATASAEAAESTARAWLLACGPEKLEACRGAALAGLTAAARVKGADKKLGKQVAELRDAETCAAKAERASPSKPPPCEATAARVAKAMKDELLGQRLLLGQALRETDEGKQEHLLKRAEAACDEPRCAGLRRRALQKLVGLARAKNDVDGAVKLALKEVQLVAAALPEREKTWARTPLLDQTCVGYETAHGAGSCRALERQVLGAWTFHDFSRDSAGEGLSADQVRLVNEHFAPLLQECLSEQAKRMTPPDAQRFEVRWVVFNDGRVGEAHLRKDLDAGPLARCLRAQFGTWRYPRYEGEFQNVEQAFTVTASERRTR